MHGLPEVPIGRAVPLRESVLILSPLVYAMHSLHNDLADFLGVEGGGSMSD